jgi:hypothetical protein
MRALSLCLAATLVATLVVGPLGAADEVQPAPAPAQEQGWTPENLFFGPAEIGTGILAPLVGAVGGTALGIIFPIKAMSTSGRGLIPYTAPGGMAIGTATGALVAPMLITEGLWDTLTFGAFSDRPFSWFKTNVSFQADVKQGSIEATSPGDAE